MHRSRFYPVLQFLLSVFVFSMALNPCAVAQQSKSTNHQLTVQDGHVELG
ncbi:MAG TPA: hypothetical protein VIJ38_08505 [Acidobacteriaceae bacterium]